MAGWCEHQGTAVALDRESIDTDQLIPARFMVAPRAAGYGSFLLHDLRHDVDGNLLPHFALNRHPSASVLVTRRNFGSGSSREAAVYALVDFGIRVVVAPSFGDIFASNAVNNGLLPARVESTDSVLDALSDGPLPAFADLETQTVVIGDVSLPFQIEVAWREKLINGWDDIDMTEAYSVEIAAFREMRSRTVPWAFGRARTDT